MDAGGGRGRVSRVAGIFDALFVFCSGRSGGLSPEKNQNREEQSEARQESNQGELLVFHNGTTAGPAQRIIKLDSSPKQTFGNRQRRPSGHKFVTRIRDHSISS
jgi:hypothetical protein